VLVPRCHHRARPIECRIPGKPTCPGKLIESFFAVHKGSTGTGFWIRNHSRPGVLCRVQYSRGWSVRICTPDRMMKTIRNRLRKCCAPNHAGRVDVSPGLTSLTPGCCSMNTCTGGNPRKCCAAATAAIRTTNPIGSSQSRLNHLLWPMRIRGAMPVAYGTEPAHVTGSTTSAPGVNCVRKLCATEGARAALGSALGGVGGSVESTIGYIQTL